MAYQNPYLSYQPSYQPQGIQQMQQYAPAPSNNGINWVSGESGAKSWMVGRGESVLLMDSESQTFYIKSADASGMPLPLRIFDYSERTHNAPQAPNSALIQTSDNFITREEFDDLKAKYEDLEKQIKRPISAKKKEVNENE
ncbi:MAG: hypothetical protein Q4A15_04515 [Prevotellaceae bacterium]|nr:hypothetical protein [Prevotellaceae bacterium]